MQNLAATDESAYKVARIFENLLYSCSRGCSSLKKNRYHCSAASKTSEVISPSSNQPKKKLLK